MNAPAIPAPCSRCSRTVSLRDTTVTADLCDVCANPKPRRAHPGERLIELAELLTRERAS